MALGSLPRDSGDTYFPWDAGVQSRLRISTRREEESRAGFVGLDSMLELFDAGEIW